MRLVRKPHVVRPAAPRSRPSRVPLALSALAALLALAVPVAPLAAQHPAARAGFTFGVGIGGGSAEVDCEDCPSGRERGTAVYLGAGYALSQRVTVGAQLSAWGKSENGLDQSMASLMAVAQLYPAERRGLFVRGGLGATATEHSQGADDLTSMGLGIQLGAGYDLRVARSFSLTPFLTWVRAYGSDGEFNGVEIGEEMRPSYVMAGIGLTWH